MTVRIEEKSLQLALVKAAGQLGVTQDALDYQILEKTNGFLGIFGKKVSIKAWKKTSSGSRGKDQRTAGHKPRREAKTTAPMASDLTKEQLNTLKASVKDFCAGICEIMAGEKVKVTVTEDGDRLILDIDNKFLAEQITKNTRLAEALEHIIRKKPKDLRQEWPFRIFIDACGVRQAREEELVGMAKNLSDKVFENRRPIVLNYRSSYDRKIIHMALDRDSRVFTKSIGSGPNRKLMILPSKEGQEANV